MLHCKNAAPQKLFCVELWEKKLFCFLSVLSNLRLTTYKIPKRKMCKINSQKS